MTKPAFALGGFLAVRCGLGLSWDQWGSMGKFVFAAVFPLGLILTVICGADLFTGNGNKDIARRNLPVVRTCSRDGHGRRIKHRGLCVPCGLFQRHLHEISSLSIS